MSTALNTKFNRDLLYNVIAFGGIVIIGFLLNIVILQFYNEKVLGVFNQIYAVYILLSQLAVGGVHLSVQYLVPRHANQPRHINYYTQTALLISLLFSVTVIIVGFAASPLIGKLLNSPGVEAGLKYALLALLFFSFNKVLLAVHNGLRNMKLFAAFQFLRFLFMLLFLLYLALTNEAGEYLSKLFLYSEASLFILVILFSTRYLAIQSGNRFKKILLLQLKYGNKALIGNLLLDVNTRVDIFALGIFLDDASVGIYSFASTIAEGFMQLPTLLRSNLNPILSKIHGKRNMALFEKVVNKNIKKSYLVLGAMGIISIIGFPLIPILSGNNHILDTSIIYAILCMGVVISAGYQPLLMVFNQIGLPHKQTLFIFYIFLSNLVFNFLLIPFLGYYGAATGTFLSFIIQVLLCKRYIYQSTGVKI